MEISASRFSIFPQTWDAVHNAARRLQTAVHQLDEALGSWPSLMENTAEPQVKPGHGWSRDYWPHLLLPPAGGAGRPDEALLCGKRRELQLTVRRQLIQVWWVW